ncbi:MAG: HAMP domain-containing histidine kinase [Deltaproteobacteria bacterium]|nr:HAMP domain-containing histidine kinase [Deltaproteobacteria bacterium]
MRRSRSRLDAALRAAQASGRHPDARRDLVDALDLAWLRQESEAPAGEPHLERLRAEQRQAVAQFLDAERQATDQQLLFERIYADDQLRTRDQFLALVAHDLRTSLQGISLTAELLSRHAVSPLPPEELRRSTERIVRATARMDRLIGDMVDVASIEAGKLKVSPSTQDARAVVSEARDAFGPSAQQAAVELRVELPPAPLYAYLDIDRSLQVLGNILANAIKFTPSGGKVRLGVEVAGEEVRFFVADSGGGIEPEHLEQIFERHWQSDPERRRGMGLGLFIARALVEAQGGRIWATSAPGTGTTFYFSVPAPPRKVVEADSSLGAQ